MTPTPASALAVLRTVPAPEGADLVRAGLVRGLVAEPGRVAFTLLAPRPGTDLRAATEAARTALQAHFGADLRVQIEEDSVPIGLGEAVLGAQQKKQTALPEGVKAVLAVASGKGGVGKSTVAANLAVSLAREGYRVGLADMDIYGPSVPTMFGVRGQRPRVNEQRKIAPLDAHGVKLLSMGMLVDDARAVVWRGPMASSAVRQFLGEADWGALDVLVLDLPPGTGDVHLTIVQTVPVTGAVIVSTPQEVALADARKGVTMFEQVSVPVLGFIENMAYFTPPDLPDRKYYLFGRGGVTRLAEKLGAPLLGEIPIEQSVREGGDDGVPVVVSEPDSLSAQAFRTAARAAMDELELRIATQPPTQAIEILYR